MVSPFRLIDLPSIPLRMVFHRMDAPQLYILSTLRRELTGLIVSLKVRVGIDIGVNNSLCYINLQTSVRCCVRWEFSSDGLDRLAPCLMEVTLYSLCRAKSKWQCMDHPRNIISRLTRIFQSPQLHLTLDMRLFSHFESMVGENDFDRCSILRLEGGSCNTEQMDRLKRTLKRVDVFYSKIYMDMDLEARKWLLNSNYMYIMHPDNNREGWFTAEDLMASTCFTFDIMRHQLTEQDVSRFIRKWIDNQSPQLRSFDVCFMQDVRKEEVMRGLNLQPYDPDRYPSHQTSERYKGLRDEVAYESNGRFFTLYMSRDISFAVWSDEQEHM